MLDAWFDFNADGDWSDPYEQIFASEPLNPGSNILTFSTSGATIGETYVRFRFSTAGGLEPNGPASDGEVEDYRVRIWCDCEPWCQDSCNWIWPPCPPLCGEYEDWVQFNKPECWCYHRQCHGDADGVLHGTMIGGYFWVGIPDLDIMAAAWMVKEAPKGPGIDSVPNGICADFDHTQHGTMIGGYFRVGIPDLDIMAASWMVKEPPDGPGISPAGCWCEWYPIW